MWKQIAKNMTIVEPLAKDIPFPESFMEAARREYCAVKRLNLRCISADTLVIFSKHEVVPMTIIEYAIPYKFSGRFFWLTEGWLMYPPGVYIGWSKDRWGEYEMVFEWDTPEGIPQC